MTIMNSEEEFLENIDKAIVQAAFVMDGADFSEELEDEEIMNLMEDRHHCGTCQVRTVMETVWPSVEEYIDWLKAEREAASLATAIANAAGRIAKDNTEQNVLILQELLTTWFDREGI